MTITREDGSHVTVKICDEHAEDATIKSVKVAFEEKLDKIKLIIEQAKSLGLVLDNQFTTFAAAKESMQAPAAAKVAKSSENDNVDKALDRIVGELDPTNPNVIPTSKLNGREVRSITGAVGGESLQSYSGYNVNELSEQLDESLLDGYAEMVLNEGRTGLNIAIPAIRTDKTGTTRITINKTENDATLQERSKRQAQASLSNDSVNFRDGYAGQRNCPLCRNVGFIKQGKGSTVCPKCNGRGFIIIT